MNTIQLPFEHKKEWEFLHRYSFLSEKHKLLYIATPKVACTSLKWWFASIEGLLSKVQDFSANSAHIETDPEMMIHQALYCAAPEVTGLSPEKLVEALLSDSYFRFALVRNPYKRIFSAWQSKLVLREPLQTDMYKDCDFFNLPIENSESIARAFEGFLEYLADNEADDFKDLHWTPQVSFLRPDLVSYTKLVQIENLDDLRRSLAEHLGPDVPDPFAGPRTNESLIPYSPVFVTEKSAQLICSLYAEDFKSFGYDTSPPDVKVEFSSAQLKIAIQGIKLIRARHHRFNEIQKLFSKHIDSLNYEIVKRDESISALQGEVNKRDESISALQMELTKRDESIAALQVKLNGSNEIVDMSKNELNNRDDESASIKKSDIWRIKQKLKAYKKMPMIFRNSVRRAISPGKAGKSVVLVTHDANCAGAQYLSLAMVKSLKDAGVTTHHIICGGGPLLTEFNRVSVTYDISYHHNDNGKINKLIHKLRLKGCETAICNTTVTGWVARLLKLEGYSVVSLVHELPYVIEKLGVENDAKLLAENSDMVIFPANVVRDAFKKYADLTKTEVIIKPQGLFRHNQYKDRRNEISTLLKKALDLDEEVNIVLGCGYADHRKGIDLFVDTAISSINESNDIAFVWVGKIDPESEEIVNVMLDACTAEIRRKILFIGEILETSDYEKYMAGSDLFFLSSREDPFPSVVLDAMSVGVPVVAFDGCGGFAETLRGVIELLPAQDPVEAALAIGNILHNKQIYKELSQNGLKAVKDQFDFEKYVSFMVDSLTKYKKVS